MINIRLTALSSAPASNVRRDRAASALTDSASTTGCKSAWYVEGDRDASAAYRHREIS